LLGTDSRQNRLGFDLGLGFRLGLRFGLRRAHRQEVGWCIGLEKAGGE
jgi:hypothetical protein